MGFGVFAALAVAVGGRSALASGAQDGLCPGTGYQNIGWSGMSKDRCLERASEVHRESAGCSAVSYSPSAGPQGSSNFCRCFSSCDGELQHPAGEQWETTELAAAEGHPASTPSPLPAEDQSASTPSPLPVPAPVSGVSTQGGLCQGTDYMNIAWGGMTREQCMERAYEVQQDTGRCGHVSYSSSLSANFCRCFARCDSELQRPAGEQWETSIPEAEAGGSNLVVLICILAVAGFCLVACAAACIWLRCRRQKAEAATERKTLAASTAREGGQAVEVLHEV